MLTLIRWFSRNPVAANLIMVTVMIGGLMTWGKLRKEIFPETSLDAVNITVAYPGAAPEEVEKGVVVPIEEAIADVEGIKRITSSSAENMGMVMVEVETGYDVRNVMGDLKTRVDAIRNMAENSERPRLEELKIKSPVLSVAISAPTGEKGLRVFTEKVRDEVLALPGVTQVTMAGVRPYEISIEVGQEDLRAHGLTLEDVARSVRKSSVDLPGGSVRTGAGEVLIRTAARKYSAEEFEQVVVTAADGKELTLGQLGKVRDGFEDADLSSRFDGERTMLVNVYRVGDQDTLKLAQSIRDYVEQSGERIPAGFKMEIWNDNSVFLKGRLDMLLDNSVQGLILVLISLTLFLRPSIAFPISLDIPFTFLGTVMLMPLLGVSINMISLFGFIMALGIIVDDATVIGENVYSRMQRGESPAEAAWKGTFEVGRVVVFGVLTTAVAFTPMLFVGGVSGKIWPNLPLLIIPALLLSLFKSMFILPAHLAHLKAYRKEDDKTMAGRFLAWVDRGIHWFIQRLYQPVLKASLEFRYVTLAVFVGMLMVTVGLLGAGWIKTEFFPAVEADIISAKLQMPRGVAFDETARAVEKLEAAVGELNREFRARDGEPLVKHMMATAGNQPFKTGMSAPGGDLPQSHLGEVTLELVPAGQRDVTAKEVIARWRELVGAIPGAVDLNFVSQAHGGGKAIDVQLNTTSQDAGQLLAATEYVKSELGKIRGTTDIADSFLDGKREVRPVMLTAEGKALGLKLEDVAAQLRWAFYGYEAQRLQRGRDEVKVMVRYPEEERRSLDDVERIRIMLADGREVPLGNVVVMEYGRSYSTIDRTDRRRSIRVTADVDKGVPGANANEIVKQFTGETLQGLGEKFPGVRYSFEGEQKDQRESMEDLKLGFGVALLGIFALLAVPLRSYFQPLIVMSVIPFGVIGAIWSTWAMGMHVSIMTLCGVISLCGMVVNSSLILVDYVNRARAEGIGMLEAAKDAGMARFRPIFATSLSTVVGLAPMVFETDLQAQFLIPMAVAICGGVTFATVITLVLVPCIYVIMQDIRVWIFEPEAIARMDEKFRQAHQEMIMPIELVEEQTGGNGQQARASEQ